MDLTISPPSTTHSTMHQIHAAILSISSNHIQNNNWKKKISKIKSDLMEEQSISKYLYCTRMMDGLLLKRKLSDHVIIKQLMRLMFKWLNHRLSLIIWHLCAWKLLVINSWFTQCTCHTFPHIKIQIHAKINRDMNMMLTLLCINCFVYNVNKVHNGRSRFINITGLWLHPLHEYELFILTCIILHNQIRNFISIIGAHAWTHKNPSTIYISIMPKHIAKTHSWEKAQNL